MAKRHLFSRVPAKASMFHLTDGFDTFAKSSGLDREFIQLSLGRLCEFAPGKAEGDMILDGGLPDTYITYRTPEGATVHSRVTYLSSDYTGERSAHFINSLVFDDGEKDNFFYTRKSPRFNPAMFTEKIEEFNVDSPDFEPIIDYPETAYVPLVGEIAPSPLGEYDERLIKRLIFALLTAAVSKNKCVYIAPVMPADELSGWALDFINTLMSPFPGNIRERISYITFITDHRKMNWFNVKFVHGEGIKVAGKDFLFDMTSGKPDNVRDGDYKAYETEINFLYDLYAEKDKKEEFLDFCARIIKTGEEYEKPTLNVLSDFILLFKQRCFEGEPEENELINNDAASLKLLTTYEKHRKALLIKDRVKVLEPLIARYSRTRAPIPGGIFNKLTRLYSKEPTECGVVIMDGFLDLAHTDAMRDKLFAFVKSHYHAETKARREVISENLSRVFYGGFLQEQILALFDSAFAGETEKSRDNILSKLLLSLRTEQIADKVFDFLKAHRDEMIPLQREAIYHAMYEAIPIKDYTAQKAAETLDHYSDTETPVAQNEIIHELTAFLEEDEKKNGRSGGKTGIADLLFHNKSPKGAAVLGVIRRVVQKHTKRKLFRYMLERLSGDKIPGIYEGVSLVWRFDDSDPEAVGKALAESIPGLFETRKSAGVDEIIQLHGFFKDHDCEENEYRKALCARVIERHIYPLLGETYLSVLEMQKYPRPVGVYAEYAANNPEILNYQGVAAVYNFAKLIRHLNARSPLDALNALFALDLDAEAAARASARLAAECKKVTELSALPETSDAVALCVSGLYGITVAAPEYMEKKRFDLRKIFEENFRSLSKRLNDDLKNSEKPPKNLKKAVLAADGAAARAALEGVVNFCAEICRSSYDETEKQRLCYAPVSALDMALGDIYNTYFKGKKKEITALSHGFRAKNAIIAGKIRHNFGKKAPRLP